MSTTTASLINMLYPAYNSRLTQQPLDSSTIRVNASGDTVITIPVPGFAPEDIQVTQAGRTLTVHASREGQELSRRYNLQSNVIGDIQATAEHGLLTITLSPDAQSHRKIEVRSGSPALNTSPPSEVE